MKEIKFRAWLERVEKMVDISQINFIGEEIDKYEGDSSSGDWWGFQFIKLMQYTGLKDKNGVEIYEGDIVGHEEREYSYKAIVKYSDYQYYLKGINPDDNFDFEDVIGCLYADLEVIGNIYENPELLEVEDERDR